MPHAAAAAQGCGGSWRGDVRRVLGGPGGDLLSHVLRRSTMGAAGFHGRVRNGVGWGTRAMTTRSSKNPQAGKRQAKGAWAATAPWQKGALVRLSLEGSRSIERLGSVSLHALPRFHTRPIDVVVYHGSDGETWFGGGFPA